MRYVKEIFNPLTFDQAKHVVLTSDPNNPDKFERETTQLVDILEKELNINEGSTLLDFGCGMGRVSKELITRFNCNVTGVDISERMKTFATLYVSNPKKFKTTEILESNFFDVCIAVLVLQHTENPAIEIQKISNAMKPDGTFIVLNENKRMVPSDIDSEGYIIWNDDRFDIFTEIERHFTLTKTIPYPPNTELDIKFYKKHV